MTQEQKAKAYDKALERAKQVRKYSSDLAEIKRMEEIFPELRESEDERIRKEILEYSQQFELLSVLPYPETWQDHSTNRWACSSLIKDTEYLWESENPVDSCVEVIIKLHKEGLL